MRIATLETSRVSTRLLLLSLPVCVVLLAVSIISRNSFFIILSVMILFSNLYVLLLFHLRDRYVKYLFIFPAVIVLVSISIYPFIYALRASLSNVSSINLLEKWRFVGINNYIDLLKDRLFWNSMLLTLEYLVFAVGLEYLFGFGFALLLNKLPNVLLGIFLIPMMVTPIAAGLIWKSMFNIDNGFINIFLVSHGMNPLPWLTYKPITMFGIFPSSLQGLAERLNLTYGFFAIVVVDIWQWTPLMCLFIVTGLRTLPTESFEMPQLDGATFWQTLRYVSIPLLRRVIAVAVLMRMIDVFKVYDTIYALFGTGVGSRTLNVHLTTYIFRTHDYAEGSALSVVILLIVSFIVPMFYNMTSRNEGQ